MLLFSSHALFLILLGAQFHDTILVMNDLLDL